MRMKITASVCVVLLLILSTAQAYERSGSTGKDVFYSGEVPSLSSLVVRFGEHGAEVLATPPYITMLPGDIKDAVMRCPDWMRENLSKKFVEMSLKDIRIYIGNNTARVYPAFGDVCGDNLPDMVLGSEDEYIRVYKNIGYPLHLLPTETINASELSRGSTSPPFVPAIGDIDGDNSAEIVFGCREGTVAVLERDDGKWLCNEIEGIDVGSYSSPSLADMDADGDLDLVVGAKDGSIRYYVNDNGNFRMTPVQSAFTAVRVAEYSSPSPCDLDDDGDYDLAVGDASNVIHYFRNIGNNRTPLFSADDPTMFAGIKLGRYNRPFLYELSGDMRTDIVIGSADGMCHYYRNFGTAERAKWEIWPFYEYSPSVGYYESENHIKYLNFKRAEEYAEIILRADKKYVDEIGFSIAHTSAAVLNDPRVYPEVFEVNAKFIYENDLYLDYVDIVEHENYTTTRYYVNESGEIKSFEVPKEIYYWYIVHPKITDEIPTFIDPEEPSGSEDQVAPPPRGKFWRDYIFNHADDSYPPDPDTDRDGDGNPDFHYPKDMKPPLLKEVLKGVKTLWNCTSYRAPAGYKNDGYNNSRPFSYGDHAIEKVSNWVEKTLPLNEQESNDGERPIQPVRIAHHHNGNCGELQDLTIAAARSALIPTAGVGMWGEDHVWSEFFERGWHQWDNYWSDGGSVIDNFGNYWYGWGERGGSGIYKWRGDDYIFEVTSQYLPEDVQSHVKIKVRDRRGNPVDGARVLMMSHWLSEHAMQQTYVTVPFPSIWNYTDENGECQFILAKNNFTIKIVSKLGSAALNKTYIGVGKYYTFNFTLPGEMPYSTVEYNSPSGAGGAGMNVKIDAEVEYGRQNPPNPVVGGTSPQDVYVSTDREIYMLNESEYENYQKGYRFTPAFVFNTSNLETISVPTGTWYIVIPNINMLETSLGLRMMVGGEVPYKKPQIGITHPESGRLYAQGRKVHIYGNYTAENPVQQIAVYVDDEMSGYASIDENRWQYDLDTTSLSGGTHAIKAEITDVFGMKAEDRIEIEIDDEKPRITIISPEQGSTFELGEDISISGRATDNYGVESVRVYNSMILPQELELSPEGEWNFTVHTHSMAPGKMELTIECADISGQISEENLQVYLVDNKPPMLTITEPTTGYATYKYGTTIVIKGDVKDESSVFLSITMPYGEVNITDIIEDGHWSYTVHSSVLGIGEHGIYVTAVDSSGNRQRMLLVVAIVDDEPPEIDITTPSNNTTYTIGTVINISGKVSDNSGIKRLEIKVGIGEGWKDITDGIVGGEFNASYNTSLLPQGEYIIKVRAIDLAGNRAIEEVKIILEKELGEKEKEQVSKEKKTPFPTAAGLISLLVAAYIMRRKK